MNEQKNISGYKVTDSNMQCRGFQYELGKTYKHKGKIKLCESGFHFCKNINDLWGYYTFNPKNRVFEIMAGKTIDGADKSVTNELTFLRELLWTEVLILCNTGKNNSGNRNSGDWNSGYRNSGNRNSGNCNSGNSNSGDWNSGDWNSGDWNSGNSNSGYFNSTTPDIINVFDKPCKRIDWENASKPEFIYNIITIQIIDDKLITYDYKTAWENAFKSATKKDIELLKALPNFNSNVFFKITGIKI